MITVTDPDWPTWELPPLRLRQSDLDAVLPLLGDGARRTQDGDAILLHGPRGELELAPDRAVLAAAEDDARAVADALAPRRLRWRWLTHDDLALLVGAIAPAAAALGAQAVAGTGAELAAAAGAVPWLGYLLWVRRNAARRWVTITDR